jgi:hypothetical protein
MRSKSFQIIDVAIDGEGRLAGGPTSGALIVPMHDRKVVDHPGKVGEVVGQARASMAEHNRSTGIPGSSGPQFSASHGDRLDRCLGHVGVSIADVPTFNDQEFPAGREGPLDCPGRRPSPKHCRHRFRFGDGVTTFSEPLATDCIEA